MGRGRQKAKQAKVARELKYNGGSTDFDALQAELSATRTTSTHPTAEDEIEPDYSAWIDDEDEDDEEEEDEN